MLFIRKVCKKESLVSLPWPDDGQARGSFPKAIPSGKPRLKGSNKVLMEVETFTLLLARGACGPDGPSTLNIQAKRETRVLEASAVVRL